MNVFTRSSIALLLLGSFSFELMAEVKLDYRQRQAVQRQESNMRDMEKKIASGNIMLNGSPQWLINKLDAMMNDLTKNKVPSDNTKVSSLLERMDKARVSLKGAASPEPATAARQTSTPKQSNTSKATSTTTAASAPAKQAKPPKLAPSARAAVDRQWKRLQQQKATLLALNADVDKATTLKKWDDRNIPFSLQSVMEDLDKNRVPKNHAYYIKIKNLRQNLLTSLENVKAKADPKVAAYSNSVNLNNFPNVHTDVEKADVLAHLYQNIGVRDLENPDKAKELLGQAPHVEAFISDSRTKYAPLIENHIAPAKSLTTKLKWLEKNFVKFKSTKEKFIASLPSKVDSLLSRAQSMSAKAVAKKNPQFFTGGVQQSLNQASSLVEAFSLAKGANDTQSKALQSKLNTAQQDAAKTAKALESEIIASNRAPKANFSGSGGSSLIDQMQDEWEKKNPDDEILNVRILSQDWVRSTGYEWNNGYSRWEKYDRQYLKMAVIVKTDSKIATIYPAFINRDNMKSRESLVASHKSTYTIRKMLVKNLD